MSLRNHLTALDGPTRLGLLCGWLFILWAVECVRPSVPPVRRKLLPNLLLTILLLATNALSVAGIAVLAAWGTQAHFGLFNWIEAGDWTKLGAGVVLLDFWAAYAVHRLLHRVGWLWQLHSVHHSDPMVDATTAFRQHPFESVLRIAFLASGLVLLGLPLWVVVVYQTLSSFNAQLEHANISLPPTLDRVLQWVIVTPRFHKIHHSPLQCETDSNYANIFSLWDRLFGTLNRPARSNGMAYGLDYLPDAAGYPFRDLLWLPFRRRAPTRDDPPAGKEP